MIYNLKFFAKQNSVSRHFVLLLLFCVGVLSKDRSIYVNVFTFLDFMWSLGALPDGKFLSALYYKVTIISNTSEHLFASTHPQRRILPTTLTVKFVVAITVRYNLLLIEFVLTRYVIRVSILLNQ